MTVQCCVCKMIKTDETWKWEGSISRHDVSHSYCPTCLKKATMSMKAEQRHAELTQPISA